MTESPSQAVDELAQGVLARDTRLLAKSITLFESARPDQRALADALLTRLLPHSGRSLRLAISGSPGVGKSTFIEAFGQLLLSGGGRLAVLAIDPSSPVSGGSILGDRLRMEALARSESVFIRPSPAGTTLGGTGRHTREAIIACEAAGYDLICVETVGVGQSETLASGMVDLFILLHLPNSGDELQGMKRGILELADFVVVTKADGPLVMAAQLAKSQVELSLMLTRGHQEETPQVHAVSSMEGTGLADLVAAVRAMAARRKASGQADAKRARQNGLWFESEFFDQALNRLRQNPHFAHTNSELRTRVERGELPAGVAAAQLVADLFSKLVFSK